MCLANPYSNFCNPVCLIYNVPEYGSCHGISRMMQWVRWNDHDPRTCSNLDVVTLVHVSNSDHNATDSGVLGGWWFGASPSSPDSNFLRVHNAFPNRRLSDNALMMPPKIRIAPSCASSPGGTPGGGGLPIRRHSSIGPQERRGSTVNLSPPTVSTKLIYVTVCVWHLCMSLSLWWQELEYSTLFGDKF